MNLIIDIGNTIAKVAVFKQDTLQHKVICDLESLIPYIKDIHKSYLITDAILSSVVKLSKKIEEELTQLFPLLKLSPTTSISFKNQYKSPTTLGLDRIALIAAAVDRYPNKNVLVIDAGTCITFDIVTNKKEYKGGAISPGLRMRYKALNTFTSQLPDLEPNEIDYLIGKNTKESIHSGVINGVLSEIDSVISQYKSKFKELTVVLTGGDMKFLSKQLKNSIFANQNFLLVGLNSILNYNKQ